MRGLIVALMLATAVASCAAAPAPPAKPGRGVHFIYLVRHGIYDREANADAAPSEGLDHFLAGLGLVGVGRTGIEKRCRLRRSVLADRDLAGRNRPTGLAKEQIDPRSPQPRIDNE